MAIASSSIQKGAVVTSFTGGTAQTLDVTGREVPNGISIADYSVMSQLTRPRYDFRNTEAKLGSDGKTWGKGKRQLVAVFPKVLVSGVQAFPCVRVVMEDYPEVTATEVDVMRVTVAQMLMLTAFDRFWRQGAVV